MSTCPVLYLVVSNIYFKLSGNIDKSDVYLSWAKFSSPSRYVTNL